MFNGLVSALRRQPTALDPAAQVSAHYALTRWSEDVAADVAWWSSPANEEAGKFDETIYQWGLDQLFSRAKAAAADPRTLFQVDFVGAGRFDMQTNEMPRILNETVLSPESMRRTLVLAAVCFWHVDPSETDLPQGYLDAIDAALAAGARFGMLTCPTERVRERPDQLKAIAARNQVVRATVAEARAACRARDFAVRRALEDGAKTRDRAKHVARGLGDDAPVPADAAGGEKKGDAEAAEPESGAPAASGRRLREDRKEGQEEEPQKADQKAAQNDEASAENGTSLASSSFSDAALPPEVVAAANAAASAAAAAAVSAIAGSPTLLADEANSLATEANGWRPAVRLSERPSLDVLLARRRVFLVDVDAMTSSVPDPLIPDATDYHYACWLHSSNGWANGPILWVGTHTSTNRYYDRLRGPRTGLCDDCVNHAIWQQVARRLLAEPGV